MQEFEITEVARIDLDGVLFTAKFDGKTFKYLLPLDALENIQGTKLLDENSMISAFESKRADIIKVARKYTDRSHETMDPIALGTENFR